jgi:hypothetical protein
MAHHALLNELYNLPMNHLLIGKAMQDLRQKIKFESKLASYFKETMAWHNCAGPLSSQAGFRVLEILFTLVSNLHGGIEL